jgi:hypothetical protein
MQKHATRPGQTPPTIRQLAEGKVQEPVTPVKEPKPSMPGSTTLKLEFPVTFAGDRYEQLVVRRLKAKDFRQLDTLEGGGNAAAIAMAALICGVDEGVIDELDAIDYMRVQEAISDFFPKDSRYSGYLQLHLKGDRCDGLG